MLKQPLDTPAGRWLLALFLVCGLNFTVFWFATLAIGGDGINGKVEDGRYYVMDHGRYTEVSPAVWHYTRIHAMSVWITHPLMMGAGIFMVIVEKRAQQQAGSKLAKTELPAHKH